MFPAAGYPVLHPESQEAFPDDGCRAMQNSCLIPEIPVFEGKAGTKPCHGEGVASYTLERPPTKKQLP